MAKGWFSARSVLWHLVFWGFAVNYMVRINLNIAIVSMVRRRAGAGAVFKESECFTLNSTNTSAAHLGSPHEQSAGFVWDEYQQGLVLGAFFWLHWTTQVPGGVLAQRFGTKLVFGLGNWIMCLMGLLIPLASHAGPTPLIILRVVQGLIGGVCWPSMHNMVGSWIPPNERGKFMTAYLGSSVGAGLTYPVCGLLIGWFDWPSVFYATAVLGTCWFLAWWFLVYDTPAEHPRIDQSERDFITESLGKSVVAKKPPVPWRRILTSKVMWITTAAQYGNLWGLFTLLTQVPTYLKIIHGWDIRMIGLLSGIPHFTRLIFSYVFSHFSDQMIKRNENNRTAVRKFGTVVCTVGQGVFIFGLAFCGCNWLAAIICVTLATSMSGAVASGPLATYVDLSPNYASITMGLSGMIGVVPGFLSPALVGALTYQNQTVGQWQIVFLISTAILVLPGILYVFFASANLQSWNSPDVSKQEQKENEEKLMSEMITLNSTKDDDVKT